MASDIARLARFVTLANKQESQLEELPLSDEMSAAMTRMLSAAEDGYLLEHVGSPLAAPLTSESLFAPTAALLNSRHARIRQDALIVPPPGSPPSPTLSREEYPCSVEPFAVRLKALWLKRRAQVGMSRGQHIAALSTWAEASETLADQNCERNFREIDNELVLDNFFNYDATVHTAASAVQHVYKKRFKLRTRSATKISTAYRCFIAYKKYQALLRLRDSSARLIQVGFRAHWRRLNAHAKRIQRWYHALRLSWVGWLARKQRLASVALQAWWRCKHLRRKYLRERAACNAAATTIQRHTRGYLAREGRNGLNLVRRFRHYRTVNRFIRGTLARLAVARLWNYHDSCQVRRRQQEEEECMRFARSVTGKWDFEVYSASSAGRHHVRHLAKRLRMADDHVRGMPVEQELQMLKRFLESNFDRFDHHGDGQLNQQQLRQLFRALKLPTKAAAEMRPPVQLGDLVAWIRGSEYRPSVLANIRLGKYTAHPQRARAVLHRRFGDSAARFAQSAFREAHRAGMYECCSCRRIFERFRPYYWHIRDGCPTTGEPSMFYSPFSSCGGPSQRDTEITVRLLKDERLYIENALTRSYYRVAPRLCSRRTLAWRFRHVLCGLAAAFAQSMLVSNWREAQQASSSDASRWFDAVSAQLVEQLQTDDSGCIPTIVCEYASEALGAEPPVVCAEVEHVPVSVVHSWAKECVAREVGSWEEVCDKLALLRLRVLLLSRAACEATVLAALEFRARRQETPSLRHCDDAENNREYLRALFAERFDLDRVRSRLREISKEWELAAHHVQRSRWGFLSPAPSFRVFGAARVAPEQQVEVPLLLTSSGDDHSPQLRRRVKQLLRLGALHRDWHGEQEHADLLDAGGRLGRLGWITLGAEVAARRCLRRLGETKMKLALGLLRDADDSLGDHYARLAELLNAEQQWKAAGMLDQLVAREHAWQAVAKLFACSRVQRLA